MKRFIYSLKSILLFSFALVGGLPILVMGFVAVRLISADIAQEVRGKNLLIAQALSSEVHLFLQRSFSFLKQVEEIIIEKRYIQEDDITAYLGSSLKTNGNFESVEILDAEGIVRFMAPSDPDVIGINRSGQEFFSHVRQRHQPYWSQTFISLSTGKPTVTLAVPVKGGMIVGYLDLASLNAVTDKISAGRQGQALMLDQEGTVIAHPDRQKIYERQNLSNLKLREQEKLPPEGSISYRENDRDYLAGLSRVPDTQWMVIVTVPADEAFKPVARVRALFGTGAVIVVFGVVTIVFLSLRKAAYPLSQLVRDTRRIAEGDFIIEKRPSSYKEIDDLVAHFRHMAGELRSREEALREREEKYRNLFNNAEVGIFRSRLDGSEVIEINRKFLDIVGMTLEETLGKPSVNLWADPKEREEMVKRLVADGSVSEFEYKMLNKRQGDVRHCLTSLRLYREQGILEGSILDITERKRAEAEKAELESQNRQLQKAESLGRMAGAIAHNFNNQLQVVMGNLEIAMADLKQNREPGSALYEAFQAARKAAGISSLILTYVGQTTGEKEAVDLSEASRRSLPLLQAAASKGMILKADFPSAGPIIRANMGQIQQVLTNLLTNAWEATGENQGAICLSVKTVSLANIPASKRFPIGWQPRERDYACLEVADAGCGIAHEDIEKLFDPFYSTKFTGRGMGLPVVLGIVKAHNGGITMESETGRGSVFRVFFPLSAEEVHHQPDKPILSPEIQGGGTVLLIEDEEQVRKMARTMLTHLGYSVLEAKDGAEAVDIFQQHQEEIRCVLSDLTMPRMNGWEALAAMRKLSPDIPVILSSGYDEARIMADEHPERPNAFLGKPYRLQELRDTIRRILSDRGKSIIYDDITG